MPRQSEPGMRDPADKEIHTREGRDPYPSPRKGAEKAGRSEDDTKDPGDVDASAPHDRGTEKGGEWHSGIEDAEEQVKDEKKAWKEGLTQNARPRTENTKH